MHIHNVGLACYGQIWRLLVRAPTLDNNFALCPIDWDGGSAGGENLFLHIFFSFSVDRMEEAVMVKICVAYVRATIQDNILAS